MEGTGREKLISDSATTLSLMMGPEHANRHGNVHGGWIMKLVDEAGALACIRHSNARVVTVAIDQMTFQHPIQIGDLVILNSEVSFVGRTSMEAEVNVFAENPITGQRWHTNTAYLVYVALAEDDKPMEVPRLIAESPEEEKRMKAAAERQAYRLRQKQD